MQKGVAQEAFQGAFLTFADKKRRGFLGGFEVADGEMLFPFGFDPGNIEKGAFLFLFQTGPLIGSDEGRVSGGRHTAGLQKILHWRVHGGYSKKVGQDGTEGRFVHLGQLLIHHASIFCGFQKGFHRVGVVTDVVEGFDRNEASG